jgi:4a-hydroxytetrahydrobiopterin dehydratase
MTTELACKTCTPCRGGISPMTANEAKQYFEQTPGWALHSAGTRIERTFEFTNFKEALDSVDRIGALLRRDSTTLNAGRNVGDASPLTVGRPRRVRD